MEITINIDDPTPVFAQLVDQIKQAVLAAVMAPGDALPSIRQLANDLGVNMKTVAKAYSLLERDSVIQTRGYRGTFIHPEARANCTVDLKALAEVALAEVVARLRAAGVTDSEMRIAFGDVLHNRTTGGQ